MIPGYSISESLSENHHWQLQRCVRIQDVLSVLIFYEMLTGKLLSETEDPLELVHCHLARIPPISADVDQKIPQSLSNIIMRLMKEKADERYKSKKDLLENLKKCNQQYRNNGSISSLTLVPGWMPKLSRKYRTVLSPPKRKVWALACRSAAQ